jgi:hypothetical protein
MEAPVREAIDIIWRLSVVAELVLTARLLFQGLGGVYPALLTASWVFALRSSLLIMSVSHSSSMARVWKITQPLDWLIWFWVALELVSKWTRSRPGMGGLGRFLFAALMLSALLVSLICWPFEWRSLAFDHDLRTYYILNRVIWTVLALFTLSAWLFLRNQGAVAPNVVSHTHITVTYFAMNALSQLALNLNGPKVAALVNLSIVLVTAGCFSAWAVLLTRKGEGPAS